MGSINFQNALGIHDDALRIRAQRSEILANNLANSDTPGFKARDLDFQAALKGEMKRISSLPVDRTDDYHIKGKGRAESDLLYRHPTQPSIDGNTVDDHIEHAEFTKNALDYNASFEFLSGKFKGLMKAIRGE